MKNKIIYVLPHHTNMQQFMQQYIGRLNRKPTPKVYEDSEFKTIIGIGNNTLALLNDDKSIQSILIQEAYDSELTILRGSMDKIQYIIDNCYYAIEKGVVLQFNFDDGTELLFNSHIMQ